jgi:hypothetical protein
MTDGTVEEMARAWSPLRGRGKKFMTPEISYTTLGSVTLWFDDRRYHHAWRPMHTLPARQSPPYHWGPKRWDRRGGNEGDDPYAETWGKLRFETKAEALAAVDAFETRAIDAWRKRGVTIPEVIAPRPGST